MGTKTRRLGEAETARPLGLKALRSQLKAQSSNGNGHAVGLANGVTGIVFSRPAATVVEPEQIPVDAIGPSPYQPRQSFPEEEIRALADSIAAQGLIQPIVVRRRRLIDRVGVQAPDPKAHSSKLITQSHEYELIDGERRWRAHQVLGLATIRAEVQARTDAEARAIVLVSALQRKELNAIEQARAFQAILDAGDAPGPTELARMLGLSQGHVSNTLRLLGLPDAWQRRVISGEIPAAYARSVVPWKGRPKVLAQIEKRLKQLEGWNDSPETAEEFADAVHQAAVDAGREISRIKQWDSKAGRAIAPLVPSEDERRQLDIVELDDPYGDGKTEVAFNTKLFDRLWAAHVKEAIADEGARKKRGTNGTAVCKEKPKTPAQVKAEEREAAQRKAKNDRRIRQRIEEFRVDWLRYLVSYKVLELGQSRTGAVTVDPLLLFFATDPGDYAWQSQLADRFRLRAEALGEVLTPRGIRLAGAKTAYDNRRHSWSAIEALSKSGDENRWEFHTIAAEWIAALFFDPEDHSPVPAVRDEDVEAIAAWLGIDCAAAWQDEQCGPLSEGYWNLHTTEQLARLAEELHVCVPPNKPKSAMVGALLQGKSLPLPAELTGRKKKEKHRP